MRACWCSESSRSTGACATCAGCCPRRRSRAEGYRTVFVPEVDACEAALVPDVDVIPVANLAQLVNHLFGAEPIAPVTVAPDLGSDGVFVPTDFREVKGAGARLSGWGKHRTETVRARVEAARETQRAPSEAPFRPQGSIGRAKSHLTPR